MRLKLSDIEFLVDIQEFQIIQFEWSFWELQIVMMSLLWVYETIWMEFLETLDCTDGSR